MIFDKANSGITEFFMSKYPEVVEDVIEVFKSFPGVGARGAERMMLAMLKWPEGKLQHMAELLQTLPERVTFCPECGNISSDGNECNICRSHSRNPALICVVENFSQIISLEKGAFFKGMYHVLGGKISPLNGHGPEDLKLSELIERIQKHNVSEVILALSSDIEGQATAIYLAQILQPLNVKVSRLAQGLPAGSDLSYADAATLNVAINNRTLM
jgi:recombination protein RecR